MYLHSTAHNIHFEFHTVKIVLYNKTTRHFSLWELENKKKKKNQTTKQRQTNKTPKKNPGVKIIMILES